MLLIALAIILAAVEGDHRTVCVSGLINVLPNGEGDPDSNFTRCVYGNCSCYSLDIALASLTSNVLINITTDVTLSSRIKVLNLINVSMIGYNNPTVNCRNIGGIHFTFCHNCIFKGITWDGCGSNYTNHNNNSIEGEPGLKLSYSSNIMIQNCLFQHSIGQVVVLLMSKNATIQQCRFFNNQGICVYVINQHLYFNGKNLFQNNTAKNGSGIYISDHSTVMIFNSDVAFTAFKGGTVFLTNNSNILFDHNSTVMFNENNAYQGTIYSEVSSNVTFTGSCKVTFNNNSANYGAAIYSFNKSHITFMGSSFVTFSNNQNLLFTHTIMVMYTLKKILLL